MKLIGDATCSVSVRVFLEGSSDWDVVVLGLVVGEDGELSVE